MSFFDNKFSVKFYGMSMVPESSWKEYGFALLAIAGGDGEISDAELEWLTTDCAEAIDVKHDLVEAWEDYDYVNADLQEVFDSFSDTSFASFNKLLIYDAVRMCRADGDYSEDERDLVVAAARILRVSIESVIAIEALVDLELAADKFRMTIL